MFPKTSRTEPEASFQALVVKWNHPFHEIDVMDVNVTHRAGIHMLPIEATATQSCPVSWFAANSGSFFSLIAVHFSI